MSGWHLLPIALTLGLLILFCPGRSAAGELLPTSDVLVPYFEVDLDNPMTGLTTLFAVGNAGSEPVDILMTVHTNWGIPLFTVPVKMSGSEIRSVNLRDWIVRGDLPDRDLTPEELAHVQAALSGRPSPRDDLYYGSEDEEHPGMAVGYVTIRTTGPDWPDVLWGDYYEVDARRGYFQAETLVDIDPVHGSLPHDCKRHVARFLNAADLAYGTQLLIWTARRWSPSPTPRSPGLPVAIGMAVFDEPGRHVEDRSLGLPPVGVVEVDHLDLKAPFGWLDIQTEEPSFITEHLHSTTTPSAALHAYCLPANTRSEGPAVDIEMLIGGFDADLPPGPDIPADAAVTWTFVVENIGTEPLADVAVTADDAPVPCPKTSLEPQESMTCTLADTPKPLAQHAVAQVVAHSPDFIEVSDRDHTYYTGESRPAIDLEGLINGEDADEPPGPTIQLGAPLTWTLVVANTGNLPLADIVVTEVLQARSVPCPKTELAVGESMICTLPAEAYFACGQENPFTVRATAAGGVTVSDTDITWYYGLTSPAISLEMRIEGQDADTPPGALLQTGTTAHWTYVVTNTGDIVIFGLKVTDDHLGAVTCPTGLVNTDETITCAASSPVIAGQYSGTASAVGFSLCEFIKPAPVPDVSASDPAHYFGTTPVIGLEPRTNGESAREKGDC